MVQLNPLQGSQPSAPRRLGQVDTCEGFASPWEVMYVLFSAKRMAWYSLLQVPWMRKQESCSLVPAALEPLRPSTWKKAVVLR